MCKLSPAATVHGSANQHVATYCAGYLILYTTDPSLDDREWVYQGISRGDKLSTTIRELTPATTYYFKVQARNSKGMGPMSKTVVFETPRGKLPFCRLMCLTGKYHPTSWRLRCFSKPVAKLN